MFRLCFPNLTLTLLIGMSLPAIAAEWSVEPTASLRSGYNDNIRLTTADHDSVWEVDATPAVKFGVSTENRGLFGNADVSIRRFYGGSGNNSSSLLDREDYHFMVNTYQKTERNDFKADINVTRDSTLDSELTETGQIIQNRATRLSTVLNPSWTRLLDERNSMKLGYRFNRVDYSDEIGQSNLVNFDFNTLTASLLHKFTPRTQGVVSTSYTRYLPENNLNSNTYNIQVGLTRQHSETLSTSWMAGWRETKADTQTGTTKDQVTNNGTVFAASITKKLETGSLGASLSRSATPSGEGQLLQTTRVALTGEHRFTETLTSNLTITYYKRDTIANTSGTPVNDNRNYYRIRPRVSWQWQREWLLSGEYEYAASDENNGGTAKRNAVYMTLTYRPTKLFISR